MGAVKCFLLREMEHPARTAHTVFQYGHIVEQVERLEYHAHLCPVSVDLSLDVPDFFSVDRGSVRLSDVPAG